MRRPTERLLDILDAIERIERQASRGRQEFESDELIQIWIVYHLQIIGEAAAKLGREFHDRQPALPRAQIVAMRNVLVHSYFGIDLDVVWNVVERDLPVMKAAIRDIVARPGPEGS